MPSSSGSPEPQGDQFDISFITEKIREFKERNQAAFDRLADTPMPEPEGLTFHEPLLPESLKRLKEWALSGMASPDPKVVTSEEQDRIADGEPYCYRCGKPASSFPEYCEHGGCEGDSPHLGSADYVRDEEGTYNPETNRFACDACYIAIGMPSGPNGWRAP